jgi:hypothetical protein
MLADGYDDAKALRTGADDDVADEEVTDEDITNVDVNEGLEDTELEADELEVMPRKSDLELDEPVVELVRI